MTKILITIDVESSKVVRDGEMHHLHYNEDIEKPCQKIIRIADKYGAKITFMLPLSEILSDHKEIIGLMDLMSGNHDIQVYLHRPIPLLTEKELTEILKSDRNEVDLIEEFTGIKPVAIRAGGYNVGKGGEISL
jgi:ribosomal protein S10